MPFKEDKELHEQDLQRIRGFRLLDDDFMTAFFRDNNEDTEYILRIILNKPTLKVEKVHTQHDLKNLNGRSVRLDIHAVDGDGNEMDIEIQREERGAGFGRARYNSSLLDASILKAGAEMEDLPDTYVIFITETDVIGKDKALYPIDRYISVDGDYIPINDGSHILYVNGAKQGDATDIERLMHDFSCTKADDMYSSQLAKTMRYYKEDEKGVAAMCKVIEDMREDVRAEMRIEIAQRLVLIGKLSLEEIAESAGLSLQKVQELANKKGA